MPRKITKADCSGCYNDFYNDRNPYGVKECWSFKSAEMVKKIDIPIDVPPPYKGRGYLPVLRPSCYKRQRYVHVKPEAIAKDGYWAR